ncbi:ABC transporter permease [Roseibacterium sp. SDUM158016]|uniref:ABC transporter permease n=1 Tax=Roseicyclus sediminis TaxID=2980997 RepID=UPI0021CECB97|nr:ABC transporter permease [Roseibacterium sp. SDUM158016]MCU4651792.1 ABC transporter permease [Roseibacterium sp. SDUM158016]
MSRPVDTPDWRALPTRGQEAERRLAATWAFLLRVGFGVALVVLLWGAAIEVFEVPPFVAPGPLATWQAFREHSGQLFAALGFTLTGVGIGLSLAIAIALSLGVVFTLSAPASRAFMPLVIGLRTVPVLAVAPLLIMIFGRGQGTTIATVVIVGFFPIMVNAMRGFRSVSPTVQELFHVAGAQWWQLLLKARIPFALPFIFTGLRVATTSALLSAMLAEWLSGAPGIGRLIYDALGYRDMGLMFAAVALSMGTAFVLFGIATAAERRLSR